MLSNWTLWNFGVWYFNQLRNKSIQFMRSPVYSASWELHQYSHWTFGAMNRPNVYTSPRKSNSETYDSKTSPLPTDTAEWHSNSVLTKKMFYSTKFNCSPFKPWFLLVCSTSLLKTLWEKQKLLAISSFPTVLSTCLENFLPFPSKLKLSSANSFSLEESKICCLG